MKIPMLYSAICFIVVSTLSANTLHVPSEYSTIQAGIDAATSGDTVLVADGTFTGEGNKDISSKGKDIVVISENGPDYTVIDCENTSFAIAFVINSGESNACVIKGFTVRNADMGFWVYANSDPTISGNIIEDCFAGINCSSDGNPTIIGNTIRNNNNPGRMPQYGGGISLSWSEAVIVNNLIYGNRSERGGGIYCSNCPSAIILNNTIIDNAAIYGGGVYLDDSPLVLTNNIIAFSEYEPALGIRIFSYKHETKSNYDGAKLTSIDYTFALQNNGEAGEVSFMSHSSVGGRGIDTSFQMTAGERITLHINSKVNEFGDFGGLDLDITIGTDILNVKTEGPSGSNPGSYYLTMSVDPDAEPASKEIVQTGELSEFIFNDVFADGEGIYYSGNSLEELAENSILEADGNMFVDPLVNDIDFSLKSNSPCIDGGTPDVTGLPLPAYDIYGNQRILDGNNNGSANIDIGAHEFDTGVGIGETEAVVREFNLKQNYPNPFNPSTTIKYLIPDAETPHAASLHNNSSLLQVILVVYDVLGKEVATLVNKHQRPGNYTVRFDASGLPSGIYFYRLTAGSFAQSRKMILIR